MRNNRIKLLSLVLLYSISLVSCSAKGLETSLKKGKNIVINGQSFDSEVDLTTFVKTQLISPNRNHGVIESNIVFINCIFNGFKAYALQDDKMTTLEFTKNLVFHHCAFNNTTDLSYIQVNGNLTMLECEIAGTIIMNNAWFKGKATSFTSSKFMGKVKALGCTVDNKLSFLKTEFEQSASFQQSTFKGKSMFNGITFHKYAGFDHVVFQNGVAFDQSVFYKDAIFDYTSFMVNASFNNTEFKTSATFNKALFMANTSFQNGILPDDLELTESSLKTIIPVKKEN